MENMEQNVKILASTSKKQKSTKKIPPMKFNFSSYQFFPQYLNDLYVLLRIKVNNSFRAQQLRIQINLASGNLQTTV